MKPQFVVVVRGEERGRFADAWAAEREAAKLRSFGFPAHAVDEHAERERKRLSKTAQGRRS
jgi:hypothetical protein